MVDSFTSASKLRTEEEDLYFSLCHTPTRNLLPLSSIPQTNGKRGVFSSSAGFLIVTPNFQYQNEKNELHPTRATLSRNFLAEQVFP